MEMKIQVFQIRDTVAGDMLKRYAKIFLQKTKSQSDKNKKNKTFILILWFSFITLIRRFLEYQYIRLWTGMCNM